MKIVIVGGGTAGWLSALYMSIFNKDRHNEVIVIESMEGTLAKLLKKSFNKSLEKGMLHWLELLKAECERQ